MNPNICRSFSTVVSRVSEQELEQLHQTYPSSLSPSISDLKVPFVLGKSGKEIMLEHDDSVIRTIPDFVARVPRAVQKRKMNNIEPGSCTDPVARLFRRTDLPMSDWLPYAHFDASKPYTRNLIATDYKTYTLLLLCWNANEESPIHDGYRYCKDKSRKFAIIAILTALQTCISRAEPCPILPTKQDITRWEIQLLGKR